MTIDGAEHTIIGVLAAGFQFPEERATVWRPLSVTPGRAAQARVQAIAAMAPGVSRAATDQQLLALSAAFRESAVLARGRVLAAEELLQRRFTRQYQNALSFMFGAVALVLLVACTNVASLLLARASSRAGSLLSWGALGSGRVGVAGHMLAESALLSLIGGIAGTLVARWLLAALLAIAPPQMTFVAGMSAALDGRVLAFALGLSLATCVLVSILPAWSAGRLDPLARAQRTLSARLQEAAASACRTRRRPRDAR